MWNVNLCDTMLSFKTYLANKQAYTCMHNAVPLVWGLVRFTQMSGRSYAQICSQLMATSILGFSFEVKAPTEMEMWCMEGVVDKCKF